jgi:hypothetical protein
MTDKLHEAIVRAALERAQEAIRQDARNGDLSDGAAQWAIDTIRSLSDPAKVAAIIKKATGDRG